MDRDSRDPRDVLPRLSDRHDAVAPHTNRSMDLFYVAPPLLPPTSQQQSHQLPPLSSSTSFQSSSRHYFQQQQQNDRQRQQQQQQQQQQHHYSPSQPYNAAASGSDSQDTTSSADTTASTDTDQLFTPPVSEGGLSTGGGGNAFGYEHDFSSQESQLLQLSELAAARARMADANADASAASRKRTADGSVKHRRDASSASPVLAGGHSRNISSVSVASTAGSRIGELSAELKARLAYAMVKVNNGWQSHSIDQVESFASQATSPTSSTSTIHGRHGASASPRIPGMSSSSSSHRRQLSLASQASVSTVSTAIGLTGRVPTAIETSWPPQNAGAHYTTPPLPSPLGPLRPGATSAVRSLAPPASIQPSRAHAFPRRNSNPGYAPPYLHQASPQIGGQHSPMVRTPVVDPILFSPHQNVREQDAIETLLFMSSPGNSTNMKHFPSSSQPLSAGLDHQLLPPASASPQRHALPSAPRKSLPTARPGGHRHSQSLSSNRRGHNRYASDMDIDDFGSPNSGISSAARGTPRRRANGGYHADPPTPRLKMPLSISSGLSVASKPRPVLGEEDIEKMLDRAAAASADDSSDSDSEILIPTRRTDAVGF